MNTTSPDTTPAETLDPYAAEIARSAPEPLAAFNRASVLSAADIHVALTLLSLAQITPEHEEFGSLALAVALAVRAPRLGHVFVDLLTVADSVASEGVSEPVAGLAWPAAENWLAVTAAAVGLVASGESPVAPLTAQAPVDPPAAGAAAAPAVIRPLRLIGSRLYLDRYWRQERDLAAVLQRLDARPAGGLDLPVLAEMLAGLFPDPADSAQRAAAACAALRGLTVVAGGPGTGKTTTVARTVALLSEIAVSTGTPAPLIALCAPTGKASARLAQAIAATGGELDLSGATRAAMAAVRASTIHRLLGARGEGRFRHGGANPLPHDVVIVDETSMVSLSLIFHLLGAVRSDARVVLVGDPDQLSAIEAGAVLRDIVGPAAGGPTFGAGMRSILTHVTGADPGPPTYDSTFGSGVVVLTRGHRFGAPIGALAEAIRGGDGDGAVSALSAGAEEIHWLDVDAAELAASPDVAAPLREVVVARFGALLSAARAGEAAAALTALGQLRLLCAHRQGRYGVRSWTSSVEEWLAEAEDLVLDGDYAGRPLMITENDYELGLYNGDGGIILAGADGPVAAFEQDGGVLSVAPARLAAIDTAFASTIHKSQGSQFATAVVILPDPDSRLLSRELLYTAVTRARTQLFVVGTQAALLAAIARPVQRATGLGDRLWTP